jgi:hypothetical protein
LQADETVGQAIELAGADFDIGAILALLIGSGAIVAIGEDFQ